MRFLLVLFLVAGLLMAGCKSSPEDKPSGDDTLPGTVSTEPEVTSQGIRFIYRTEESASSVHLSGTFNEWRKSDPGFAMEYNADHGYWSITVSAIPAGVHQYRYYVDGTWQVDKDNPNKAPDGFGGFNNVIEVE